MKKETDNIPNLADIPEYSQAYALQMRLQNEISAAEAELNRQGTPQRRTVDQVASDYLATGKLPRGEEMPDLGPIFQKLQVLRLALKKQETVVAGVRVAASKRICADLQPLNRKLSADLAKVVVELAQLVTNYLRFREDLENKDIMHTFLCHPSFPHFRAFELTDDQCVVANWLKSLAEEGILTGKEGWYPKLPPAR